MFKILNLEIVRLIYHILNVFRVILLKIKKIERRSEIYSLLNKFQIFLSSSLTVVTYLYVGVLMISGVLQTE
jgi:hypothetical protein